MANMKKKKLRKAFAPTFEPYTEERKKLRDLAAENTDEEHSPIADLPIEGPKKKKVFDAPSGEDLSADELQEAGWDERESDADLEFSAQKKKPARKRRPLDLVRRLRDKFSE